MAKVAADKAGSYSIDSGGQARPLIAPSAGGASYTCTSARVVRSYLGQVPFLLEIREGDALSFAGAVRSA